MFYCSFYFTCSLAWTAPGPWLPHSILMLSSGFVSANLPWRFSGRSLSSYLQGNRRMVWRLERPLAKCAVCKVQTTSTGKVTFRCSFPGWTYESAGILALSGWMLSCPSQCEALKCRSVWHLSLRQYGVMHPLIAAGDDRCYNHCIVAPLWVVFRAAISWIFHRWAWIMLE